MYEKNSTYDEDDDTENYHTIAGCSNESSAYLKNPFSQPLSKTTRA